MAAAATAPLNRPILATARMKARQVRRTQRRRPLLTTARGTACGFRCTRPSGRLSRRMFPDAKRCGPGSRPRSSRITHFGGAQAANWVTSTLPPPRQARGRAAVAWTPRPHLLSERTPHSWPLRTPWVADPQQQWTPKTLACIARQLQNVSGRRPYRSRVYRRTTIGGSASRRLADSVHYPVESALPHVTRGLRSQSRSHS